MTEYATIDSPIGELLLTAEDGALTGLHMSPFATDPAWRHDPSALSDAATQLEEYFAGERTEFSLELAPAGTEFQQRVWGMLREIAYGETTTYGTLANRLGNSRTVRAVGLANGRNPIAVIIPCHRVIGADGSLVGFGGGLDRKRALLDHETEVATGFRSSLW
jgi:methylated-DNA-[protein]-cysteine S-methyltransferase